MLKLPTGEVKAAAKRKFDRWMGSFGLANSLAVCVELQRLIRIEKKRRRGLEDKR